MNQTDLSFLGKEKINKLMIKFLFRVFYHYSLVHYQLLVIILEQIILKE